ncbi:MAG: cytochrome c oxidase subunit II, partial [Pseudomonadota bacterium]
MRRFTPFAAAAVLGLAVVGSPAHAQDLDPITPGATSGGAAEMANDPDDSRTIVEGGLTTEEAVAATPDDPAVVPSVTGGIANAGTMASATLGQPLGGENIQPQV